MALSFKKQLINYLSRRNFKSQNAFTLVELIVVVVIIGILSSIAIPSFQNASEKAKQKEASSMLASYAKAAQAYYTEYGQLAISPRNLGEYVTVSACRYGTVTQCKSAGNALYNNTNTRANARWYTPTGNYQIYMNRRSGTMVNFLAYPRSQSGLGAVGCYNTSSGATRIQEMTANQKGTRYVRPITC